MTILPSCQEKNGLFRKYMLRVLLFAFIFFTFPAVYEKAPKNRQVPAYRGEVEQSFALSPVLERGGSGWVGF
jgi:hypothetical protein